MPLYVPRVDLHGPFGEPIAQAGWGDAAVLVPWVVYQRFGDLEVLRRQYPSMCAWVDGLTTTLGAGTLFDQPPFQLGDWLDPAAPPDNPTAGATDPILVATAYRVRTAQVLSRIAGILGQEADSAKYAELAGSVRQAFHDEYVTPNGRVASDSQTGYALALEFSLLPDENQRARAAERLVEAVRTKAHKIATGFLGTPLICDALTSAGAIDDAYQLLLQQDCPSWLYPVTMGATTIWERWDSLLPDGSVNPGEMTSFNHYAFGAVADWMHRVIGGLAPGVARLPGPRRRAAAGRRHRVGQDRAPHAVRPGRGLLATGGPEADRRRRSAGRDHGRHHATRHDTRRDRPRKTPIRNRLSRSRRRLHLAPALQPPRVPVTERGAGSMREATRSRGSLTLSGADALLALTPAGSYDPGWEGRCPAGDVGSTLWGRLAIRTGHEPTSRI